MTSRPVGQEGHCYLVVTQHHVRLPLRLNSLCGQGTIVRHNVVLPGLLNGKSERLPRVGSEDKPSPITMLLMNQQRTNQLLVMGDGLSSDPTRGSRSDFPFSRPGKTTLCRTKLLFLRSNL